MQMLNLLFVNLLIFYYFVVIYYLLQCDFRIKIEIKQLLHKKKEYFIQKIEITPKRLEIGIHNVNKSDLKIKFYIYNKCHKW
jgi:hypothetical protein